jgi:hypothetical protein
MINDQTRTIAARYLFVRGRELGLKEIKVEFVGKLQLFDVLAKGCHL